MRFFSSYMIKPKDVAETTLPLFGGCLCGAVRFEITANPLLPCYCHCTMCQKQSGAPFVALATVPFDGFSFIQGEPVAFESTPGNLRMFCGACGSPLGGRVAEDPKLVAINICCLDNPNLIKPEFHGYTSTQVSWCEIDDGLPSFVEGSPDLTRLWVEMEGWDRPE